MWRHRCLCLCGAQPRDTNYKPISSLPPPSRPRRRWNRGVGGARPPGLKVDPLLNASPSLGSIHFINSAPQVKFSAAPLPRPPPPPPPLQCLTFIGINTFDQFRPRVKFPSAPSVPPFPPSLPPAPPPPPPPPAPSSMPHLHCDQ